MNFKSISARILFSFGILIVIIMSYLVYSIHSNIQTNKATEQIIENELDILVADYELARAIHARIAAARGYILTGNPTYKDTFQEYVTLATETDAIIKCRKLHHSWRKVKVCNMLHDVLQECGKSRFTKNLTVIYLMMIYHFSCDCVSK